VRSVPLAVLAVVIAAACSSGQPSTFAVTGASVDATYLCPGGASNAHYDLHAMVSVHNGTAGAVTIKSVTAQMTLVAVQGAWLEKPGDRYDAGAATFSPSSVAAGSTSTINVTIGSACTSDKYGAGSTSHGDYSVTIVLVTSAGRYSVTARNQHEIRTA
jgi:hypothetical protein